VDGEPPAGPLRIGYIGTLMPHKGVHLLVDAAQAFRRDEIELHLFGGGPDAYVDFLKTIDMQRIATFHGAYRPDELPSVLANVDVVCVPSVWEDCAPHVVQEALAAGCPVIGSNIGGIPDLVRNGVTGLLTPPREAGAIVEAIRRFVSDPGLLLRMRSAITPPAGFQAFVDTQLFHYREVVAARRRDQARQAQSPARSHSQPMNRDASADVAEGFSCRRATGRLPHPLPSPLVLNLGCGADIRPDMVNIDLFSDHPSVVGMDVRHLELPDGCADLILASDVLEHFSHREVDAVLAEWSRVLKPGGEIVVRCPSLRLQVQAYLRGDWDADVASYMIFGGQTNPGDYHTIAFDQRSIRIHLSRAGLEVYDVEEQDIPQTGGFINLNMVVRARKTAAAEAQARSRDLHARAAGP
jgi:predicted SAM-dependent methyltransferase